MHPILIAWLVIGGFIGGIVQIIFSMTDTDEITFYNAFWFAIDFYETYHDQINCVGMVLAIIVISVFVLPGSLVIVFLVILGKLLSCFWRGFMYIFKKRNIKKEKQIMNKEKIIKGLYEARRYLEDKEWSDENASPHIDSIIAAIELLKEQTAQEAYKAQLEYNYAIANNKLNRERVNIVNDII